MELTKYQHVSSVYAHIKHDMRQFEDGRSSGNEDIVPELTHNNYSLIDRGKSCKEINSYRKELEKEIFSYNRKNIVHAVELSIQLPDDCPKEQEEEFFQETHRYLVSTLPMGERCVIVSEVHKDERHYAKDGTLLSKDHLHFMYVPAVPDTKHDDYEWRLCADQLTKRAELKKLHPGLQKHLNDCGIHATVYRKSSAGGKSISLSIDQLKELTRQTGIKLGRDHQLSVTEISKVIEANILKDKQISALQEKLHDVELDLTQHIEDLKTLSAEKDGTIQKYEDLKESYDEKTKELNEIKTYSASLEVKNKELEKQLEESHEHQWGRSSGWGQQSDWGHNRTVNHEEEF